MRNRDNLRCDLRAGILLVGIWFFVLAALPPGEAKSATRQTTPDQYTIQTESEPGADRQNSGNDGTDLRQGIFNPFMVLGKRIGQVWNSGGYDLYLPAYTWHNRLLYDSSHRRSKGYNEHPWGGGFGRSFLDEDGDSHSLYLMGFMDSNNRFQPIGGYGFVKNWYLDERKDLAVGLGYTLSITARHEYNYIPLPLPLPILSLQYKQFAVQCTYIPMPRRNDGNVLFAWLRWHFN